MKSIAWIFRIFIINYFFHASVVYSEELSYEEVKTFDARSGIRRFAFTSNFYLVAIGSEILIFDPSLNLTQKLKNYWNFESIISGNTLYYYQPHGICRYWFFSWCRFQLDSVDVVREVIHRGMIFEIDEKFRALQQKLSPRMSFPFLPVKTLHISEENAIVFYRLNPYGIAAYKCGISDDDCSIFLQFPYELATAYKSFLKGMASLPSVPEDINPEDPRMQQWSKKFSQISTEWQQIVNKISEEFDRASKEIMPPYDLCLSQNSFGVVDSDGKRFAIRNGPGGEISSIWVIQPEFASSNTTCAGVDEKFFVLTLPGRILVINSTTDEVIEVPYPSIWTILDAQLSPDKNLYLLVNPGIPGQLLIKKLIRIDMKFYMRSKKWGESSRFLQRIH